MGLEGEVVAMGLEGEVVERVVKVGLEGEDLVVEDLAVAEKVRPSRNLAPSIPSCKCS